MVVQFIDWVDGRMVFDAALLDVWMESDGDGQPDRNELLRIVEEQEIELTAYAQSILELELKIEGLQEKIRINAALPWS